MLQYSSSHFRFSRSDTFARIITYLPSNELVPLQHKRSQRLCASMRAEWNVYLKFSWIYFNSCLRERCTIWKHKVPINTNAVIAIVDVIRILLFTPALIVINYAYIALTTFIRVAVVRTTDAIQESPACTNVKLRTRFRVERAAETQEFT